MTTDEVADWALDAGYTNIGFPGFLPISIYVWRCFQLDNAHWQVNPETATVWSTGTNPDVDGKLLLS